MLLIIKKVFFLVGLTLYVIYANSQIVISTRNGVWTDPAIWSGGFVPTSANATQIIIDHEVELPDVFNVSVLNLVVNSKLSLKAGSLLNLLPDALPDTPDMLISGVLVCEDNAVLNGTSTVNTSFASGSVYLHQQGPLGFIPYATWHTNSTFIINGFKNSGYINIAHSDSWKQRFGNVVYDCPQQTIFVVDLNGYLRNIGGDFIVRNTNNRTLRLSTTQNPAINIDGNFVVEGPSEVWLSTNGSSTSLNILKDFRYRSTSTGPSYLTTRGTVTVNVFGDMEVSSVGPLRMTSSSADSVGARLALVNLSGDLSITSGIIIAPPLGSGGGRIVFRGSDIEAVKSATEGTSFQGNLDFVVESGSTVSLGNSALSNTTGSLVVKGTIQVGSSEVQGAIQLANKGNILVKGARIFEAGSTIEYNGTLPQYIGQGHPSDSNVNLIINNPTSTFLLRDLVAGNLYCENGTFDPQSFAPSIHGNLVGDPGAIIKMETVKFEGNQTQSISADELVLNNLNINKSPGTTLSLLTPTKVKGQIIIESENTVLFSDGHLTLLSLSDGPSGTACVGSIPGGSRISGDVTVQRYMSGEGRIYRYISSPVAAASVASLMDDFPVTGSFTDPSTGDGFNRRAPSLYFYDESQGGLQDGWRPYPTAGLAQNNKLLPGLGYAAFIRRGVQSTTWDVTGTLNQGQISLPVFYTSNNAPSNGWNLVGNPYACTIDWDIDGPAGWTKQNVSSIIAIRDNGSAAGGTFKYWDGDINYSDIPEGRIASGQSIWVRATAPNPVLVTREGVKVVHGASFYREGSNDIPSFVLILKKDTFIDKAYFKVRPEALEMVDDWDAIKMENDNFDISSLSPDSVSLAINAQPSMPCDTKVIRIVIKDLKRGAYKIELQTKFDFKNYMYTWIDQFLDVETIMTSGGEIDLNVTDDPESAKSNRFSIRLEEKIPFDSLIVVAPPFLCSDTSFPVLIRDAGPGVYYSVYNEDGIHVSEELIGDSKDLRIDIHSDLLKNGRNKLVVKARSACHQRELVSKIELVKDNGPVINVKDHFVCAGESVTLKATSELHDLTFTWFESEFGTDTVAITHSLTIPDLMKTKTFYVVGVSREGCSSKRYPVVVNIINIVPARISRLDGHTLLSNYHAHNRWYWKSNYLSGTDRTLTPLQSGNYILRVDTLGCVAADSTTFYLPAIHPVGYDSVEFYPNPVDDMIHFWPGEGAQRLDIVSSSGMIVREVQAVEWLPHEELTLRVDYLSPGIYFMIVHYADKKELIRFVKLE